VENTDVITGYSMKELAKPYYVFRNAGYEVEIASIRGGKPTAEPSSLDKSDHQVKSFLEDPNLMNQVNNTQPLSSFNGRDLCAVYFVGGYGCMFDFAHDPAVEKIGREVYEHGGIVAAVCHGPIALANIRLSHGTLLAKNKTVSGYTNEEEQQAQLVQYLPEFSDTPGCQTLEDILNALGGKFCKGAPNEQHTARDGQIITGQNPQSAEAVAHHVIQAVEECKVHGH
jgi:putative intracellular protease/amidase